MFNMVRLLEFWSIWGSGINKLGIYGFNFSKESSKNSD